MIQSRLADVVTACLGFLLILSFGTAQAVQVNPGGVFRIDYDHSADALTGPFINGQFNIRAEACDPWEGGTSVRLDF